MNKANELQAKVEAARRDMRDVVAHPESTEQKLVASREAYDKSNQELKAFLEKEFNPA